MQSGERSTPGRRRVPLALVSLTLFLVLLPLTLTKPGLPATLKADEAAYYLGALSLWHDGDLICDDGDVRRLFREFSSADNLVLMGTGPTRPVYFGIPIFYPLLATPFVAAFGANGLAVVNAALLMAMVWMGFAYLRRTNDDSQATLFSVGFFLLSTAFVYVFWLQAEVFNMACVMAAFFLIDRAFSTTESTREISPALPNVLLTAGSAALLATATYSKPMLGVLAVPMLYRLLRARAWRASGSFTTSGVLTLVLLGGTAYALTEQAWPYFAPRFGISASSPLDYMERRVEPRLGRESPGTAMGQLSRRGEEMRVTATTIVRMSVGEFLWGRHGGFLIYMPFAVLAILFFLLHDRRSGYRWLILVAAGGVALLFVTLVRGNWLGGGGFVGNRYFLTVYPSFLFLVQRLRPSWLIAVGYAAAAVLLGPLLIAPLGAPLPKPPLQAHVSNEPLSRLPLEWSLVRALDGYRNVAQSGAVFHGKRNELMERGDEMWVLGVKHVELTLLTLEEKSQFVFEVRSLAPENRVEICLEKDCRELIFSDLDENEKRRVVFEPGPAKTVPRSGRPEPTYRYKLTVDAEWGEQPRWRTSRPEHLYVGASLAYLGSPDDLERNLRSVDWLGVESPQTATAGKSFPVQVSIRNTSPHDWPSTGPARVRIGYRWLDEAGADVLSPAAKRSDLPADLAAGEEITTEVLVEAPETPGPHTLVLDMVRERVRWFSSRRRDRSYRVGVQIQEARPVTETAQTFKISE